MKKSKSDNEEKYLEKATKDMASWTSQQNKGQSSGDATIQYGGTNVVQRCSDSGVPVFSGFQKKSVSYVRAIIHAEADSND